MPVNCYHNSKHSFIMWLQVLIVCCVLRISVGDQGLILAKLAPPSKLPLTISSYLTSVKVMGSLETRDAIFERLLDHNSPVLVDTRRTVLKGLGLLQILIIEAPDYTYLVRTFIHASC